jgi:hypothetical protein
MRQEAAPILEGLSSNIPTVTVTQADSDKISGEVHTIISIREDVKPDRALNRRRNVMRPRNDLSVKNKTQALPIVSTQICEQTAQHPTNNLVTR